MTVKIEVSKDYLNRTSGLCGRFDGMSNNDKLGRDGLHKATLQELAESWNEEDDCTLSDDPEGHEKCEEVSGKSLLKTLLPYTALKFNFNLDSN